MAKRFTDTNKYKTPFMRSLKGAYKLFWDYLYHDCDHAGIWIVDFDIAQIYIGLDMPINKEESLECFNADEIKIIEIDNGKKWFIPSFIEFQYGVLNKKNRAHNSVIAILKKYDVLNLSPLLSPLQGRKDKEQEQDKDKDKDINNINNKVNVKSARADADVIIPDLEKDIIPYAKNYQQMRMLRFVDIDKTARAFYNNYASSGWVLANGQKLVNWKTKLNQWLEKDNDEKSAKKTTSTFNPSNPSIFNLNQNG